MSQGTSDDLLYTIESNLSEIEIYASSGESILCALKIDHTIGLMNIVGKNVENHDRAMSLINYFQVVVMNNL